MCQEMAFLMVGAYILSKYTSRASFPTIEYYFQRHKIPLKPNNLIVLSIVPYLAYGRCKIYYSRPNTFINTLHV
jgi:hypothetical protein